MYLCYSSATGFPDEAVIRIGSFVLILAAVALAEIAVPRRPLTAGKARRWWVNLVMTLIDTLLVRLLFPILPVGIALICEARGWGFLNHFSIPYGAAVALGVLTLDLTIYLQHVMVHMLPLFWRLHGVHHTDLDIDTTTGIRFHPLEIVLSALIKVAVVAALGVPALGVILFDVILNGTSLFNHGNIGLPVAFDRWLRLFVVTPDMHRVHHSVLIRETNSNFGFNFPWWDRLFGTYRSQPAAGHEGMTIGLAEFRKEGALTLGALLLMPFGKALALGSLRGGRYSSGTAPGDGPSQRR